MFSNQLLFGWRWLCQLDTTTEYAFKCLLFTFLFFLFNSLCHDSASVLYSCTSSHIRVSFFNAIESEIAFSSTLTANNNHQANIKFHGNLLFESPQPKVIVCLLFGGLSIMLSIVLAQTAVPSKNLLFFFFHLFLLMLLFSLTRFSSSTFELAYRQMMLKSLTVKL